MFSIFKTDPAKKLRKQYEAKLEEAMHAQRNGDIFTYSQLSANAEELRQQLVEVEEQKAC